MKRGFIWIALTCLIVSSLVLASCAKSSTSSTAGQASTPTTATTGNWWDKLGKPQYGGEMNLRLNRSVVNFDPYNSEMMTSVFSGWMEKLFTDDWTSDPSLFPFLTNWTPPQYIKGQLAESYEFTDPSTFVVHLRHGVHWQNIPPANGREFTSDDVVFHYDRLFGLGSGVTPSPYWPTVATWQKLTSVTATDKYTVVFKWNTTNPEIILETMEGIATSGAGNMENQEAVKQWGNLTDWHHAIGTGPFILKDFVTDSTATLVKNPNYWGYDERYPKNKLPYIDTLNLLIIPDNATALAAMRTGKIDVMEQMSPQDAQQMKKTNPEILQISVPYSTAFDVDPRNDVAPFKDIRVREALQMAIDLPTIAKTYYNGTCSPDPCSGTSVYETGWGFPYNQWPQDLKDEYAYNPTKAKQLLADAGYPNGFNTDVVGDAAADFDLLQIVKSYFADVGVNMSITKMDTASFTSFVVTNHKQDALAYRSVGFLGVAYEPTRQFAKFLSGYPGNYINVSDPVYDAFNTQAMTATSVDDVKKALAGADEYIARQHLVISLLQPNLFALYQPWLKGYSAQWGGAATENPAGASLIGFYPARWWIDQTLKKSMGH